MAVYIDKFNAPYGRMLMCHMVADSTKELLEMVDKICVARKWIQKQGTNLEHFDICLSKKKEAIKFGAIECETYPLAMATVSRKGPNDIIKIPNRIEQLREKYDNDLPF